MSKQVPLNKIPAIEDEALLVSRDQARVILGGISYSTILRLEAAGRLRTVRLSPGAKAKAFFKRSDVVALAESYWTEPVEAPQQEQHP